MQVRTARAPAGSSVDGLGVELVGTLHDELLARGYVVAPCAMASSPEAELRQRVSEASGQDASWTSWRVIDDQEEALRDDVNRVRAHPLIPDRVEVGGFLYDVDTGRLQHLV